MEWNRCAAACCIAELLVGSALADFCEAEFKEDGNDFVRLENGNIAHNSSDSDVLDSHKLGLQRRFAIFQKHCNNITQIMINFIQRCPLGMSARKPGDKTNEQAGLWASFNYSGIDLHGHLQRLM